MKKMLLEQIKAGSVFTQDVFIEGNNVFVRAGVPVKQKDLDQLAKWGVLSVMTEGEIAQGADQAQERSKKSEARIPAISLGTSGLSSERFNLYKDCVERLSAFFDAVRAKAELKTDVIDKIVAALLQSIRDYQNEMVGFILGSGLSGNPLAKSSVNTAILSIVIGAYLKLPSHKLMQLATGALLHDIGMLRVPEEIIDKKGQLSMDEAQKMRSHPLQSYKIITKELLYPDDVGIIALQHHERWNGEGYPRRIAGQEIELPARIVSVADAFEAMVSEKAYRDSMKGYEAMKNLLSDNSRRFDPDILKAFIKVMGIYPIGSVVFLSNAAIARVIGVHQDAPLRPKLRIIVDEYGTQFLSNDGEVLDLLTEKSIFIVRALNPKEFGA